MKVPNPMLCRDDFYVWIFIAFWLFDRVVRVLRLTIINRGKPESYEATVEALGRHSVRLILPNRHISWRPGQHVYLIIPSISTLPFETHPFTIANIPERDEKGGKKGTNLVFYIRAMEGFTRKLYDYAVLNQGKPVTALVDGPYGQPPPVNSFSTVMLIAGEHSFLEFPFNITRYRGIWCLFHGSASFRYHFVSSSIYPLAHAGNL